MSFRDLIESDVTDAHERNAKLRKRHIKKPDAAVVSAIEEGKVNYAKASFAGDDGYGSGKAKWRQTDAAHKIDHDEVGAGEQGSHEGGSGLIKSKADSGTDKLALRKTIHDVNKHKENQSSIRKFAISQTRGATKVKKPTIPESEMSFRELVEGTFVETHQKDTLLESMYGPNHFKKVAGHALANALDEPHGSEEHHKWMCVHHKAMAIQAHHEGDSESNRVHEHASERHADHINGDEAEEFHNGESHHWGGF